MAAAVPTDPDDSADHRHRVAETRVAAEGPSNLKVISALSLVFILVVGTFVAASIVFA